MGRPLNKRYFGDPADPGTQFIVNFWDGALPTAGYIVKQLGSRRFRVTNGTITTDGSLVVGPVTEEGQVQLTNNTAAQDVVKITGRRCTLADGTSVAWVEGDFTGAQAVTASITPKEEPKIEPKVEEPAPKAYKAKATTSAKPKATTKAEPKAEEPKVEEPAPKAYKPRAKAKPKLGTRAKTTKKATTPVVENVETEDKE